jgi:triacylglycerol lipase
MRPVRIYLSPGMFGFATLAAYDYFEHVVDALRRRFEALGERVELRVCEVHPTASIRRRATKLEQMIASTAGSDDGPIHIVGHSTGGLDARLVASPSRRLDETATDSPAWQHRLRSVTTMNTPHYGTPLASFFATAQGQRLLYAVCALTVAVLKLGAPPMAAASGLVAALGRSGAPLGIELALVERLTNTVAGLLDDAASVELRDWLREVRDDQGGVVQLMPEAMDLFEAGIEDRPGVRYQSVASYAQPGLRGWIESVRTPWAALSAVLFQVLHRITALQDPRYPCGPPEEQAAAQLFAACGELPPPDASDGVVPVRSQLWGELCWLGRADHLDIVGHFAGPDGHNDWLASGAGFNSVCFEAAMDCMTEGMLRAQ